MMLLNHPILCNYYVTYRCNAACSFCDIWERPSPYISVENAIQNFDHLKKLGVKVIDFTGGEPLLHREIDVLLIEAKKRKFMTTLTTNTLLYPKWAKKIKGKVDMLHFSIDSADKVRHNESRKVDCFDHLMESIKLANSLGERPDLLFTVFEHTVNEIEPIYNLCIENNLMLIINPAFDYNNVETGKSFSKKTFDELKKWSRKKYVYLNLAFLSLRKDGGNRIEKPVCKAGSTTIVISPENELVVPCYHLGEKTFPIDNNLTSLYRSEEVQELVKLEGKLPACQSCIINCYMEPSFAVNINKYWFQSLNSTFKYNIIKGTWKHFL